MKEGGNASNGLTGSDGLALLTRGAIVPNGQDSPAMLSHGPQSGTGQNHQRRRPWCEHCHTDGHTKDICWKLHGKPANWKPRQNNRYRGYQATIDQTRKIQGEKSASGGAFSSEQMEQLYKMFSSFQHTVQSSSIGVSLGLHPNMPVSVRRSRIYFR